VEEERRKVEEEAERRRRKAEEQEQHRKVEEERRSAREEATRVAGQFRKGTKIQLSPSGCEEAPDYDWGRDALKPGDLGEVLSCRIVNDLVDVFVDVFVKGPSGRTDSYNAVDLERIA